MINIKTNQRTRSIDIINVVLIPILIIFMSVFRDGNLQLLYFVAPIVFVVCKNKFKNLKNILQLLLPFILIFIITIVFSQYFNNMSKSLIYLLKILLCIVLFVCLKNSGFKLNYFSIVNSLCWYIFLLTLVALLTQSETLWRFNDTINSYSTTRLQLFFMEPSELSEITGILLIIQCYFLIKYKNLNHLFMIIIVGIPLLLSAGLSGIVYSFISVVVFLIIYEIPKLKKKLIRKRTLIILLVLLLFCMLIPLMMQNSKILQRISAVLNGEDGSFNYRFSRATEALQKILGDTNFVGVGLGNLRTDLMENYLSQFNLQSFSNSYLFFVAEGGAIAIFFLCFLIIYCVSYVKKDDSTYLNKCMRYSLLFFVIIIQITGGYFTDPFLWVIYGVICSFNDMKQLDVNYCSKKHNKLENYMNYRDFAR